MIGMTQSIFIGVGIVALSLAFFLLLNHLWPMEQRRQHNEVVGWQVSVVGTTYAVIIGFMLFAVWTDFEVARTNVEAEAVALVNVANLSRGLPQDAQANIQTEAKAYADLMVNREWITMNKGGDSFEDGQKILQDMWATLTSSGTLDRAQQTVVDHSISQLSEMTHRRSVRLLESQEGLPGILWAVLIVGAAITVSSSCLFGTNNFTLHMLQVLALATLLALSLLAVADIDRPFQGFVRVSPEAFVHAREVLALPWPQMARQ